VERREKVRDGNTQNIEGERGMEERGRGMVKGVVHGQETLPR